MIGLALVLAVVGVCLLAWSASSLAAPRNRSPGTLRGELLVADDRIARECRLARYAMRDAAFQAIRNPAEPEHTT